MIMTGFLFMLGMILCLVILCNLRFFLRLAMWVCGLALLIILWVWAARS